MKSVVILALIALSTPSYATRHSEQYHSDQFRSKRDLVSDVQTNLVKAIIKLDPQLVPFCNAYLQVPVVTATNTVTKTTSTYATAYATSTPLTTSYYTNATEVDTSYTPTTQSVTVTLSTTSTLATLTATTTNVTSTPVETSTSTSIQTLTSTSTVPGGTVTVTAAYRMVRKRRPIASTLAPVPTMPSPLKAFASNIVSSACKGFTSTSTITVSATQTQTVYTSTSTTTSTASTQTLASAVTTTTAVTVPSVVSTYTMTSYFDPAIETSYTSTSTETDTITASPSTLVIPTATTTTTTATFSTISTSVIPKASTLPLYRGSSTCRSFGNAAFLMNEDSYLHTASGATDVPSGQFRFDPTKPGGLVYIEGSPGMCWSWVSDGAGSFNIISKACDPNDSSQTVGFVNPYSGQAGTWIMSMPKVGTTYIYQTNLVARGRATWSSTYSNAACFMIMIPV